MLSLVEMAVMFDTIAIVCFGATCMGQRDRFPSHVQSRASFSFPYGLSLPVCLLCCCLCVSLSVVQLTISGVHVIDGGYVDEAMKIGVSASKRLCCLPISAKT